MRTHTHPYGHMHRLTSIPKVNPHPTIQPTPVRFCLSLLHAHTLQIFITSKIGPPHGGKVARAGEYALGYQETLDQFEEVLQTLGVDYVDLLLVHWPVCADLGWCPSVVCVRAWFVCKCGCARVAHARMCARVSVLFIHACMFSPANLFE